MQTSTVQYSNCVVYETGGGGGLEIGFFVLLNMCVCYLG